MLNSIRLKPELCVREKIDMSDKVSKSASRPAKRRQTHEACRLPAPGVSRLATELPCGRIYSPHSVFVYNYHSQWMKYLIVILFQQAFIYEGGVN